VSWAALGVTMLLHPGRLTAEDLVAVTVYLGTASIIAVLAHLRRYALSNRELLTRVRLEHEQQRTGVLLTQLERLSHEDPLTGLANRRRWDAELVSACTEARRRNTVVGVVLVDIDHFKHINDRHGHPGGDEALREVAGLLSRRVRTGDLVARLGGDELAVLLPGSGLDRAVELAERLRREAAELVPAGFDAGEINLSLGVASAGGDQAYPLELMSRADEQLYRAKITRNAVGAPRRDPAAPLTPALAEHLERLLHPATSAGTGSPVAVFPPSSTAVRNLMGRESAPGSPDSTTSPARPWPPRANRSPRSGSAPGRGTAGTR
jgi:diguanylate cyclase (GGDEF)-like protein